MISFLLTHSDVIAVETELKNIDVKRTIMDRYDDGPLFSLLAAFNNQSNSSTNMLNTPTTNEQTVWVKSSRWYQSSWVNTTEGC